MLRRSGARVGVFSGDRDVCALVPALVDEDAAFAGLTPDAKLRLIRDQRTTGSVAMVGDGFNDAPALAAADLGIAVGAAVDLTRVTADVLLLGEDLCRVAWLLDHARRVRRVMVENLVWAVGYNGIAVVLAMVGKLTPVAAALVMVASSLLVVANSRRLLLARSVSREPFSQRWEGGNEGFPDFSREHERVHPNADRLERHVP
jgi:P-type E1-E2 ATPase